MELLNRLAAYVPVNEQETTDRELMIRWLTNDETVFSRDNLTAHMTASAWVVTPDRSRVLMAYHKLYDSWAWLGGHADGEQDLAAVAQREAMEESGLESVRLVTPEPISVEILTVDGHEKRGRYVPSHLHLNVTYLFEADPDAPLRSKPDENSAVAWVLMDRIEDYSSEPWFCRRIYSKLAAKAKLF